MKVVPSVAYHEAGHAAIAIHLGVGLKRVSVVPGHDYAGICTQVRSPSLTKLDSEISDSLTKRAEKMMMVALAGAEAQRKFAPTSLRHYHAESDRQSVFEYAFTLCGSSEEASALANLLRIRTRNLLHLPFVWSAVKAIAKKLLKQHEIKGKEAKVIYETACSPTPRRRIETIVYGSVAEAEAAGLTVSKLLGNKPIREV